MSKWNICKTMITSYQIQPPKDFSKNREAFTLRKESRRASSWCSVIRVPFLEHERSMTICFKRRTSSGPNRCCHSSPFAATLITSLKFLPWITKSSLIKFPNTSTKDAVTAKFGSVRATFTWHFWNRLVSDCISSSSSSKAEEYFLFPALLELVCGTADTWLKASEKDLLTILLK